MAIGRKTRVEVWRANREGASVRFTMHKRAHKQSALYGASQVYGEI